MWRNKLGSDKYFKPKNLQFLYIEMLSIFQAILQLFKLSASLTAYTHILERIYLTNKES